MPPAAQRDQFLVASEVVRDVPAGEVLTRGKGWDAQLSRLAPKSFGRDEAVLAHVACVESAFHQGRLTFTELDAAVCPALDHIMAPLDSTARTDRPSLEAVKAASSWIQVALEYEPLAVAVINVLQDRMRTSEVSSGRLVFWPSSSLQSELRNRWFEARWMIAKSAAGGSLLPEEAACKSFIDAADKWVASRMKFSDDFSPPNEVWLTPYVDTLADRILAGQFAHVAPSEKWGSLSASKIETALRPLYRRAARRFFLHSRVFAALKAQGYDSAILPSCVEVVSLASLSAEVQSEAKLDTAAADNFVKTLLRAGKEERHKLSAYPLVPLSEGRAVFLPSSVLYANWPVAREQAVGRARDASIGEQRDRRHVAQILAAFHGIGMSMTAANVLIQDADRRELTDLDIVAVAADMRSVFVAQIKSFVTPTNLVEFDKSDRDVSEGLRQCQVAADNIDIVRKTVESRFKITLPDDWKLFQIVVVEAIAGSAANETVYPVVTMEWFLEYGLPHCSASPGTLWSLANELPDGKDFFEEVRPVFSLHDVSFDGSDAESLAILGLLGGK